MFKKLSRAGNSHAIIIDKPILQLLGITPNTLLKITTDGNKIVVEPVSDHLPQGQTTHTGTGTV